ncbi:hypothetical protein Bbelb_111920 [Branchiostoma belcheri]|nr:hypothetical protein Bbelb_406500 [Branchiostoma belcheri]KAI8512092.1 hypothetical protein Bbelb_111920 [Branchiostoma belcheri]
MAAWRGAEKDTFLRVFGNQVSSCQSSVTRPRGKLTSGGRGMSDLVPDNSDQMKAFSVHPAAFVRNKRQAVETAGVRTHNQSPSFKPDAPTDLAERSRPSARLEDRQLTFTSRLTFTSPQSPCPPSLTLRPCQGQRKDREAPRCSIVWRNNGSEVMLQRADPGDLCRAPSGLWDCLDQRSPRLLELFKVCHLQWGEGTQQGSLKNELFSVLSWPWPWGRPCLFETGGRDPGHGGGHVCLKLEVMTLALGGGHVYVALEVVTLAMGAAMFVPCWSVGNNPLSVRHSLVQVRGHVKGHGDSDPLVSADLST